MTVNKDFVVRTVAGETMLIPVGKNVLKYNGIFTLSESGAMIYKLLCEGKADEEIIAALNESFDADEATLRNDFDEFIQQLKDAEIILP
ncbi:MAG: PqqD family protein [Acutalibacteraceae bacterium]